MHHSIDKGKANNLYTICEEAFVFSPDLLNLVLSQYHAGSYRNCMMKGRAMGINIELQGADDHYIDVILRTFVDRKEARQVCFSDEEDQNMALAAAERTLKQMRLGRVQTNSVDENILADMFFNEFSKKTSWNAMEKALSNLSDYLCVESEKYSNSSEEGDAEVAGMLNLIFIFVGDVQMNLIDTTW